MWREPRVEPIDDAPLIPGLFAVHELRKAWGDRTILDGLELVLDRGTLNWVGGENGIGKTTLLRICAGLILADSGVVDLDGLHPRRQRASYQERVGFLSAGDRGLYARLTVRQHLELWGRLSLLPRGRFRAAIERMIARLDLGELADRRMDRLSMGQRQRVRLAMAFLHEPDLVLLDEPLNSLDPHGVELLSACLAGVTGRGGAVLWVSPAPPSEISFDTRQWLEDGRLTARPRR
ncbi:MAG TPA: ABC transporter ATP-binding protein [Solirubrobacterales bacterium]|nr:ABC transporter ATP-binding protein [Solirubrobacterales bacterium]